MLDLEQLMKEWSEDSAIDSNDLTESSRKTPQLHAKYLQMFSLAKLALKKREMQQKILLKDKWLWYNGKMPVEDIEARNWEYDALNGLKILKGEMHYYYDSDPDIQLSEQKIEYYKTLVATIKEILDHIRWRSQNIKNIIDYRKFQEGG
jgi:hypothetical protein